MKTIRKLEHLAPDPQNSNKHTERGGGMMEASIRECGFGDSLTVDREGVVISGNQRLETLADLQMLDPIVIQSDGSRPIVHQRVDLKASDKRARTLALASNRVGQVNLDWNKEILAALSGEIDMSPFFSPGEFEKLLGAKANPEDAPEPKLEIAEELAQKWGTKPGQLWLIPSHVAQGAAHVAPGGAHRLLCGDSTDRAHVARLMAGRVAKMAFTDPPWNVAIGTDKNLKRQRKAMKNDDLSPKEYASFLETAAKSHVGIVAGDVYCILGASEWPTLDRALRGAGYHWSATIIWVKDIFVFGRGTYHRRYEPMWYGWHSSGKSSYRGDRDQDDVWEVPRPRKSEEHPTMKPVALPTKAILNSSLPGDIVLDLFLGAGSTMVAAEQLGRLCFGQEVEPKYVAVVLERMKEMGLAPQLEDDSRD